MKNETKWYKSNEIIPTYGTYAMPCTHRTRLNQLLKMAKNINEILDSDDVRYQLALEDMAIKQIKENNEVLANAKYLPTSQESRIKEINLSLMDRLQRYSGKKEKEVLSKLYTKHSLLNTQNGDDSDVWFLSPSKVSSKYDINWPDDTAAA